MGLTTQRVASEVIKDFEVILTGVSNQWDTIWTCIKIARQGEAHHFIEFLGDLGLQLTSGCSRSPRLTFGLSNSFRFFFYLASSFRLSPINSSLELKMSGDFVLSPFGRSDLARSKSSPIISLSRECYLLHLTDPHHGIPSVSWKPFGNISICDTRFWRCKVKISRAHLD